MTWEDIHGWFDYADIYREAVTRCRKRGTIIELGVWCGKSLAFLAQETINQDRNDIKIFGVDLWEKARMSYYQEYMQVWGLHGMPMSRLCEDNLIETGLRGRVELLQLETVFAAQAFENNSVDFVWFDSDHDPRHVRNEIEAWLPKLKRPTWCGGHDATHAGLFDAVRGLLPNAKQVGTSWTAELTKTAKPYLAEMTLAQTDKVT